MTRSLLSIMAILLAGCLPIVAQGKGWRGASIYTSSRTTQRPRHLRRALPEAQTMVLLTRRRGRSFVNRFSELHDPQP